MPRLTGRRPRRRDRGAVAVLVAVMVTSGMTFGFGALTVDVGLLYAERTQLQTAADAAAIAVAKVCALHMPECNEREMLAEGRSYARRNVKRSAVEVGEVCGVVLVTRPDGQPIQACPAPAENLTRCLGEAAGRTEYVEVRVRTDRDGDTSALPPVFAGAVTGTDGITVGACARASWRSIATVGDALPIVLSDCVTRHAIDGSGLQRPPVGGAHQGAAADAEIALPFREIGEDGERFGYCQNPGWTRQPGERRSDATDGFGGAVLGAEECETSFTIGTTRGLAGVAGGDEETFWEDCFARLAELREEKTPVPVAVYRPADGDRAYIDGVRAFVVTGWHKDGWPSAKPADPGPGERWNERPLTTTSEESCPADAGSCLFGYFTTDPAGGGAAGPSSIRITG